MATNLNEFARRVTLAEGKRIALPIGQVKEVTRLVLIALAAMLEAEALAVIRRYRGKVPLRQWLNARVKPGRKGGRTCLTSRRS